MKGPSVESSGALAPSRSISAPTRYESLDVWRGIACLAVVLFHGFIPSKELLADPGLSGEVARAIHSVAGRLWIGVPIFFVISGYCISAASDIHRTQWRPIHDFFVRRMRRIYPPYFGAVAITMLVVLLCDLSSATHRISTVDLPNPAQLTLANWLGNLTLGETLRAGLTHQQPLLQLWPAWSLCHEVQFYAICGLFLLAVPRHFFRAAAALTLFVAVATVAAPRLGIELPRGSAIRGTWLMFAMGLGVYWQAARGTARAKWTIAALLLVVVVAMMARWRTLLELESNTNQQLFYAAITALALIAAKPFDAALCAHRWLAPLARVGKFSFSVYLIHLPIIRLLNFEREIWLDGRLGPTCLVLVSSTTASVVAAYGYYLLVERRWLGPARPKRSASPVPAQCGPSMRLSSFADLQGFVRRLFQGPNVSGRAGCNAPGDPAGNVWAIRVSEVVDDVSVPDAQAGRRINGLRAGFETIRRNLHHWRTIVPAVPPDEQPARQIDQ